MSHIQETGCNLTREDFHPEGDEPCVDGGAPEDHVTYHDIYECQENGGNVWDDIRDMDVFEMEQYFLDADPAAWL